MTDDIPPEHARYARWLHWSGWLGLAVLVGAFVVYATGLVPPVIPLERLPELWKLSSQDFMQLHGLEGGWGMQTDLRVEGADAVTCLPFTVQDELYHIVHEALNIVLKHSNAQHVRVDLHILDTNVHLEICDDGAGFTCSSDGTAGGLGLSSMKERSQRIGGQLRIESSPGHGTGVLIDVPISPAHLIEPVSRSS